MSEINLTIKEAKNFLIHYQGLHKKSKTDKNEMIMTIFNRLGCIQYDPLNVVGRNPDLVLQSRIHNYNKYDLIHLLYKERQLIDAWDKMLSIYPTSNWPSFNRVRESDGQGTIATLKYRNSIEALDLTDSIKQLIADKGPLQASKLKSPTTLESLWGHRKLSSAALDYLFSIGQLGIWGKSNTQKVYDLIENIIPSDILNTPEPFQTKEDFLDWYVLRRINAVGLLWNKNGGAWLGYHTQNKGLRTQSIKRLLKNNSIHKVTIESISEDFYMATTSLSLLNKTLNTTKRPRKEVRFLAPLDNLMWDRDFIETLFKFKYRWEVYTPVIKREFGYYVLPILYGNDLIGRIEFDYYRSENDLNIINTWFQPSFTPTKSFQKAFDLELENFSQYLKSSNP